MIFECLPLTRNECSEDENAAMSSVILCGESGISRHPVGNLKITPVDCKMQKSKCDARNIYEGEEKFTLQKNVTYVEVALKSPRKQSKT